MLIYLLVNFLVNYYFFAFILLTNGLIEVLIFVLVDVLRDFLLNSFFLWFTHLFNAKKIHNFTTTNQEQEYFSTENLDQEEGHSHEQLDPLFQIQTISSHAKPWTFIWFQIQPLTVCFNSCDVWTFLQIQSVFHGLVCRFLRQRRPDTWQCSSRQCWEQGRLVLTGCQAAAFPENTKAKDSAKRPNSP